jgi:hypothetical protein
LDLVVYLWQMKLQAPSSKQQAKYINGYAWSGR